MTVYVNKYPVPAAQLSVFVFQDNHPLNAAPDLPEDLPLPGFFVELVEAGGTYGASGGQVTQDYQGNPLGTTYDAAGNVLALGNGIVTTDANGVAVIKNLFPAKYTIHIRPPAKNQARPADVLTRWAAASHAPRARRVGRDR